jgi:hypothetical protein
MGNIRVTWSRMKTDNKTAENLWNGRVSDAYWQRTGRLVQNNSRNMARGSDITNCIHLIPWECNGFSQKHSTEVLVRAQDQQPQIADDIDLLEEDRDRLQGNLEKVNEAGEAAGLQINIEKTTTMVFVQEEISEELEIRDRKIENVTEFVYLGSLT